MKNHACIALAILSLISAPLAFADVGDIKAANNQISGELSSTHVDYTETDSTGATLDTEKGSIHGYAIRSSAMWSPDNYYVAVEYSHHSGTTQYVGSYWGGTYGDLVQDDGATLTDYSARLGKGIELKTKFMLTPFAELGHHEWDRTITGAGGYNEIYTHDYVGIGVLGQYSPVRKLVLSVNTMLGKTMNAHISTSLAVMPDASLGSSTQFRVGISCDYAFVEHFHGNIGLDLASFKYGASSPNSARAYEPDSTTYYAILKAGIGYSW